MSERMSDSSFDINRHLAKFDIAPLVGNMDRHERWIVPTMADAVAVLPRRKKYFPPNKRRRIVVEHIEQHAMCGNPDRIHAAIEDSESLIADAIAADPRLARRSQWTRGEEGELVCPALLAQSDDAPCFYRRRAVLAQPNGAEPVKVVISTDSSEIKPKTAAAFIAVARLVQQYRPLEIWWQGSWLSEDGCGGWVFHVPLVSGDTDYSRLDYCINDPTRDNLSWAVMMTRAVEVTKKMWGGCSMQANRSYLPGAFFVDHEGVKPTGEDVADTAASWLGMESIYSLKWDYELSTKGALMKLPDPTQEYTPRKLSKEEEREREKDRKRWEKERIERIRSTAKQRIQNLNTT